MASVNNKITQYKFTFDIVKKICDFCKKINIWVDASYIKSEGNIVADKESVKPKGQSWMESLLLGF